MVTVTSTKTAASFFKSYIENLDYYIGDDGDPNTTVIKTVKGCVDDPQDYRDFLISKRNEAVKALDELEIPHEFSAVDPDIRPVA